MRCIGPGRNVSLVCYKASVNRDIIAFVMSNEV
jgi:hypothetical protein